MLSTVQIVSGDDDKPWSRDDRMCVKEIRTEHKLNDPTTFSILMFDVPGSDGKRHRLLEKGSKVAVLVRPQTKGSWQVLFQGKVSEIDEQHTQGGLGSTVLFRGKDIRTMMAARTHTGSWTGKVDAVMRHLIELDFSEPVVDAPTNNDLVEDRNPLGQNSNNLDFLTAQAQAYGHNFWLSYKPIPEDLLNLDTLNPLSDDHARVDITPIVHWARSPYFSDSTDGGAVTAGGIVTAIASFALPILGFDSTGPIVFKVHLDKQACPNVSRFEVVSEGTDIQTMPRESEQPTALGLPAIPNNPLAPPPTADTPGVHFIAPAVPPAGEDDQINEALQQERGFNRKVRLSTTVASIKRLCFPNNLATFEGVPDSVANQLFRVREATHVIRPDAHWIDASLEGDGREYNTNPLDALSDLVAGGF